MRKKKKNRPQKSNSKGIAYQNKDITSKMLAERFKDEFFGVFGLELPAIVDAKPTNLASVEANELRIDNIFKLEDNSYVIIDYESDYSEANKFKYLNYIARVSEKLYNELKRIPQMRLVIIYTADVAEGSTNSILDLGVDKLQITETFLRGFDAEKIVGEIEEKIRNSETISNRDLIRLIICPLAVEGKQCKVDMIRLVIDLTAIIKDDSIKRFVLKGLLAFTDKVIDDEDSDRIRRMLTMTKVEQLIYDDVVAPLERQNKALKKKNKDQMESIVLNMIRFGDSPEKVAQCTGMTLKRVEELATHINA